MTQDLSLVFSNSHPFIVDSYKEISRSDLFRAAYYLSQELPDDITIINLYEDRLSFIVMLLAVGLKGGVTILPPDTATNTLLEIANSAINNVFIASDSLHSESLCKYLKYDVVIQNYLGLEHLQLDIAYAKLGCQLNSSEICLYTSGSTGAPKKVVKTWKQMISLAYQAIDRLGLDSTSYLVSSVPCQHMYGLETTVFWPLLSGALLQNSKPFYPADFEASWDRALNMFPNSTRILISTPLHLKNYLEASCSAAQPNIIISATAPMNQELAQGLCNKFNALVYEVLGSTETASFASRSWCLSDNPNPQWTLYKNNLIKKVGESFFVSIQGLEEHLLSDSVEVLTKQNFNLLGRRTDIIKLAGKRNSLLKLNQVLQKITDDGVFILSQDGERLEALVVSNKSSQELKKELRNYIDPVFLPRMIYFVEKLPRNNLGKLSQSKLDQMINSVRLENN